MSYALAARPMLPLLRRT